MNILLLCAAGASTGVLVKKMKDSLSEDRRNWRIEAHSLNELKDYDSEFDVILLGPQVSYKKKEVEKSTDMPVEVINSMDYGLGRGANVVDFAIKLYESNK